MIKKCPYCDFEPIQDQLVCPNCGSELNKENLKQETDSQEENNHVEMTNDDINWSNFEEVPLGSVIEHFHETMEDEMPTKEIESSIFIKEKGKPIEPIMKEAIEEPFEENPILSAYIRRHKEGADEEELIAAIESQQQKETMPEADEPNVRSFEELEIENLVEEDVVAQVNEVADEQTSDHLVADEAQITPEEFVVSESAEVASQANHSSTAVAKETVEEVVDEALALNQRQVSLEEALPKERINDTASELSEAEKAVALIKQHEQKIEQAEQVTEETQMQTKLTEPAAIKRLPPSKSKKPFYIIGIAGVLLAAGSWWLYSDYQAKAQAAQAIALQTKEELGELETQLNQLFLDNKQEFLKPGVTSSEVKEIRQALKKYQTEEAYPALENLSATTYQKATLIETVNQYFTQPIVVGDELMKDVHIKDETPVVTSLLNETTPFAELVNEALQRAKIEYQQVQSARDAVERISETVKEGQLTDQFNKETLVSAQKEVEQLFESPMKEALLVELQPVEEALTAYEAAEKEKQLAAQKKAEEEAAAAQQQASLALTQNEGQEILSPNTPTNRNHQPIISTRPSDLADGNNPAWQWAPGVYDAFITSVINKGYVVAGGFILEPVRIENGEGYYHLYATSNQSSLLKGIPQSEMPYYLVTVNAKTGFYKGNGNG